MFKVNPIELLGVREALREDPLNLGVGVLHLESERIAVRPFNDVSHRGGHIELVAEYGWLPDECLGFVVARPTGECTMINLSHLNSKSGRLLMLQDTFRKVLLSLRQCWVGMAASESAE